MNITIRTVTRSGSKHVELRINGVLMEIKQTKNPLKETVKILRKLKSIEV